MIIKTEKGKEVKCTNWILQKNNLKVTSCFLPISKETEKAVLLQTGHWIPKKCILGTREVEYVTNNDLGVLQIHVRVLN